MPDPDEPRTKPLDMVPIPAPPAAQRVCRGARFAEEGERRTRYHLPEELQSASPVGYRTRPSLTPAEAREALSLLSLDRPRGFVDDPGPVSEQELFEECSLGVLSARQSTNYRGQRVVLLGPQDSRRAAELLAGMQGVEAPPPRQPSHTHLVLARPYRTPFTLLLTFVGHPPVLSLGTVPIRALRKRFQHIDDIPTIGYLQHLHLGILAEATERAAILASTGRRRAQVLMAPFCGAHRQANTAAIAELEALVGLSAAERAVGWRLQLAAPVGELAEPLPLRPETCRRLGATLLSLRSERIQPGVNAEDRAPEPYQHRQDMDVPDALVEQAGRAAFNAFAYWTGAPRAQAKDLLLLERVDVLRPDGKDRLRQIRTELEDITDRVVQNLPLWADLPLGRALSRNAARGRKAFALAGQRIYIGGLSRGAVAEAGLDWDRAVRACGAAASRSALVAELMGVVALPPGCDLLAGCCLMAGPVNQNDVGKQFYGYPDLLARAWPDQDPTSLLVWTLKAKTVADPVGNEEQLLNPRRKGALVDLRAGPHELVRLRVRGQLSPMRQRDGRVNGERAFAEINNFLTDPEGREIPGNRGSAWPRIWAEADPWAGERGGQR